MYHLKTSIPSYRQVFASTLTKPDPSSNNVKSHFVYHVEVAFLGEYGKSLDQFDERPNRGAKFYRIEKRYSAFLALHNEVCKLSQQVLSNNYICMHTLRYLYS